MDDLQQLIQTTHDAREVKRALAVQNTLLGRPRATVAKELGYTVSWVDKWRWRYAKDGVDGLRVGYKGSVGYLTAVQRVGIKTWLQTQKRWDVHALARYIDSTYHIRYKSAKSYRMLLDEAHMSWKKAQDEHPDADPQKVAEKRVEIKKKRFSKPLPSSANGM